MVELILDSSEIVPGTIIESTRWPEPVQIKKSEMLGDHLHLVGSMLASGLHVDVILTLDELNEVKLKTIISNMSGQSWKVFLALEATRYRFASIYDPLLAMNTSKVDPLPHQIEAVYGYVLRMPRIRYLLAHDPGAGKTIMAGLIVKELKLRHLVNRILVVVPGHLKDQWRRELREKFEETFIVIDRGITDSLYGENIWNKEDQIITSMDFAKQEEILSTMGTVEFDLIVVDEAHKMAAYKYNDKITKTQRYRLGEILSNISQNLIFLTATPHKGDTDNFRLLLDLLQPGFFATNEMLKESIAKNENSLFLRRIKEDMKDFEGKPLFLPRTVSTPAYRLSDMEKELYNKLILYLRNQYNRALFSQKKRNIGFALVILQRRLSSSCYSLWRSLQRRKERLEQLLQLSDSNTRKQEEMFEFEEVEEMNEEERWAQEKLWETLSIAENKLELQKEIDTLEVLIQDTKKIIDNATEIKLTKLKEVLISMREKSIDKKILIFTESKDTLDYLEKRIRNWGYSINTIHGGMNLAQRVEAEKIFKNQTQVMVATEAAGEGINLQFCHLMINYDIPWNPNRLEQRMGRIHRYGQKYEVFVYNLIAMDTIEGRIFRRLFEKLTEIKNALNSDKVYDIIGEIYYEKDLVQLLTEAAIGAKSEEQILAELEITVDPEYVKKIREDLGDTLVTKNIDFTQLKDMRERARENRLIPEYTAALFKKAFLKCGGRFREKQNDMISVDSIPFDLRTIAQRDKFRRTFGTILKNYPKITFAKEVRPEDQDAEFVTFGHPLFESILEWILNNFNSELQRGATFIDPSGLLDGYILFYEGTIIDGTGNIAGKRLFSLLVNPINFDVQIIEPTVLWDLQESSTNPISLDIDRLKSLTLSRVINSLSGYQDELQRERDRQSSIKQKYGVESLQILIRELDEDLLRLDERKVQGENVDLVIRNKQDRQRQYMHNKDKLEELIERERSLTISTPNFIGIIKVEPPSTINEDLRRDANAERIAMETVLEYERNNGRYPEDVSNIIGPGYDIRSVDSYGNVYYIEVKGKNDVGPVSISKNEWFKARHLGQDYYLYVVWNTDRHPNTLLKIIRNPTETLNPKLEVHYLVNSGEIEAKSII